MNIDDVGTLGVIGAGNMGRQIAMLAAICGYRVSCTDANLNVLATAKSFGSEYLNGRVAKGRLTQEQAQDAADRLSFTAELGEAVATADYVIEAIIEKLDVKRKLFAELDQLAPKHAILATNSSGIVSSRIADATSRPSKVLNVHFFNPALVMKLVEVVKGPHVSEETAGISMALCQRLKKEPVLLRKEVKGFLLNRILDAIGREAQWLLEMDVASVEDIDKACVFGAGHPMGPFRLEDLTGLDLSYIAEMETFRETGDPADLPRPRLVEHYVKGEYGQKSGKGWYDYIET
ncbi:MAG: 3-hydroxyacyl-CoA dehydrogenase family protein [Pseudomonadota bacterium]